MVTLKLEWVIIAIAVTTEKWREYQSGAGIWHAATSNGDVIASAE
jgi:hypothetical protein